MDAPINLETMIAWLDRLESKVLDTGNVVNRRDLDIIEALRTEIVKLNRDLHG